MPPDWANKIKAQIIVEEARRASEIAGEPVSEEYQAHLAYYRLQRISARDEVTLFRIDQLIEEIKARYPRR